MSLGWRPVVLSGCLVVALTCAEAGAQQPFLASDSQLMADYLARWLKGDAKGLASLYETDAINVAADGVAVGRAAIEQRFATNFAGPWKGATIALTPGSARAIAADTRIVEGTYVVTGLKDANGKERRIHGRFINTLVNRGGTWMVASAATFEVPAPPAPR